MPVRLHLEGRPETEIRLYTSPVQVGYRSGKYDYIAEVAAQHFYEQFCNGEHISKMRIIAEGELVVVNCRWEPVFNVKY